MLESLLPPLGWSVVHEVELEARPGRLSSWRDMALSIPARSLLTEYPDGIYAHQRAGIERSLAGRHVCLSTATASGKSLVAYVSGIETLASDPRAKVLAIYPLKALGAEQTERWRAALATTTLDAKVGRIDGGVPVESRFQILRTSRVVVMTPDVIHAWLLGNAARPEVQRFLANLRMVFVDEAHTYSGVFGSNAAFLFRRLNHLVDRLGGRVRYVAASATMRDPSEHLRKLTGLPFEIVGSDEDTSPSQQKRLIMAQPPAGQDLLTACSSLMLEVVRQTDQRFLAFVDSRKRTEYLASVAARASASAEKDEDAEETGLDLGILDRLHILPYRSGYEEDDRKKILDRLVNDGLRGVVCTSALEMGIDIPDLTLGFLIGIPYSETSFRQRIGRIGRAQPGTILVVNDGSILSEAVFARPDELMGRPLAESTLYLENRRIQYIHALCLAAQGGEDEAVGSASPKGAPDPDLARFETAAGFPADFVELCRAERIGQVPPDLQPMKLQAGDDPHHVFPLRDVDTQFQVQMRRGPEQRDLGSLSYGQLMREAYPGAVYFYQTQTYRVCRVRTASKLVDVRQERHYTTRPTALPTLIFPNFRDGERRDALKFGDLTVVEASLQVHERISGYVERRGPNKLTIGYPLDSSFGYYFDSTRFTRRYFTSGVLFNHPSLALPDVERERLAEIVFEAFMMTLPFDRQDVQFGSDQHRADASVFRSGDRFLSVYDATYGSLRLTGRLMDPRVIEEVLARAAEIARQDRYVDLRPVSLDTLVAMRGSLAGGVETLSFAGAPPELPSAHRARVVLPGSKGLAICHANEEFEVEDVFYTPRGLSYRGVYAGVKPQFGGIGHSACKTIISVDQLLEIPGESRMGYYDLESGALSEQANG